MRRSFSANLKDGNEKTVRKKVFSAKIREVLENARCVWYNLKKKMKGDSHVF